MISSAWPQKAATHATAAEIEQYDIHVKDVDIPNQPDLNERTKWVQQLEVEIAVLKHEPINRKASKGLTKAIKTIAQIAKRIASHPRGSCTEMELSDRDIATYAKYGLIVPDTAEGKLSHHPPNVRMFSTIEEKALNNKPKRRRGIGHTADDNVYGDWFDAPVLQSPLEQALSVGQHALCIDFASFYHQLRLSAEQQHWYFYDNQGRRWKLTTLPTGATFSPLIAQLISSIICDWIKAKYYFVSAASYIDNIRLSAPTEYAVRIAMETLMKKLSEGQLIVNETTDDIKSANTQLFQYLGIKYSLQDPETIEVELTEKQKAKLRHITSEGMETLPMRRVLQYLGVLTFASITLGRPRAPYYHVLKFMRRRASEETPLDGPAEIWPSVIPLIRTWATDLLNKPWEKYPRRSKAADNWVVFSDASDSGYGVVLLTAHGSTIRAAKWDEASLEFHINIKEALALRAALQLTTDTIKRLRPRVTPNIQFYVDNTSVIGAVRNTISKSWNLNAVLESFPYFKPPMQVQYVKSASNIADGPSRQQNHEDITVTTTLYRRNIRV